MAVVKPDRQTVPDTPSTTRKPAGRRRWIWLALTLLLAAAAVGGWFWWQARQRAGEAQTIYSEVSVIPAAYDLSISGPGTLGAAQSVSVSTSVAGTVQNLASVGDRVNQGQTLAQLETATLQETVTEAQLTLEQAQTQLESLRLAQTDSSTVRTTDVSGAERSVTEAQRGVESAQQALSLAERLNEVGSESATNVQAAQNTYDNAVATLANARENLSTLSASSSVQGDADAQNLKNAELAVSQAQLTLDRANRDLADATISAPIAGVVTAISDESSSDATSTIKIQAGTALNAGQTLLTLSNYETIELVAQVDETQISSVKAGQTATVSADAVANQTFTGEVTAVSPSATVQDNIPIFEVTVQLANPDLVLRPGMTAEASIAVQTLQNTLSVPSAAVQTFGDNSIVELEQDGRAVPLAVEVIGTDGLNTVVQAALAPAGAAENTSSAGNNAPDNPDPDPAPQASRPNPGTLLSSGEAVTVRVPSSSAAAPSGSPDDGGGGFGGPPPRAGFGGPR